MCIKLQKCFVDIKLHTAFHQSEVSESIHGECKTFWDLLHTAIASYSKLGLIDAFLTVSVSQQKCHQTPGQWLKWLRLTLKPDNEDKVGLCQGKMCQFSGGRKSLVYLLNCCPKTVLMHFLFHSTLCFYSTHLFNNLSHQFLCRFSLIIQKIIDHGAW